MQKRLSLRTRRLWCQAPEFLKTREKKCLPSAYLPGHGAQHGRGHEAEEHQALRDEAEVADAPGGHDLVQAAAAAPRALRPPRLLALAQLGVEAPHGDEQHHVAHGPEEAEEAEARDHQVPELQVSQLKEGGREAVRSVSKPTGSPRFKLEVWRQNEVVSPLPVDNIQPTVL